MRVEVGLRVTFSSPFVVGTGALADSPADKPTFRDAEGRPVIPGSALKGKVRHACESLLRALTKDETIACHGPNPEQMCPQDPARLGQDYCPICQLFGGPSRTAALHFSDLHWELVDAPGEVVFPPLDIRSGVSIRRSRRVAEPERLFTTETFAPMREIVYVGQITGNLSDDDNERYRMVALLVAGLRSLTALGGSRSRGLGWCRIEATPVEILDEDRFDISQRRLREGLLSWLP